MYDIQRVNDDIERIVLEAPKGAPPPLDEPRNVYLLRGQAPALIDAGHPSQFDALCRALEEAGVPVSKLQRVLYTSWDIDALGAAANLPNCDHFVLSPDMVEPLDYENYIDQRREDLVELGRILVEQSEDFEEADLERVERFVSTYFPPMPSRLSFLPIRGGHTVAAGRFRFEVIAAPGPTPGHAVYYDAERATLFGGSFTLTGLPTRLHEVQSYLISLERLQKLEVEALFLSRGEPTLKRGGWSLRRALRFLNNFMSNAPAVMHREPTVVEFIERDLGHPIEDLAELVLQLERYQAPMDELVRSKMIEAEGDGLGRRYGVDVEDDRAPLRPDK
ncbi:MAG: MBL fold metallo-hydrolase [Persicimonas sp.]